MAHDATKCRLQLGAELCKARESAGMTQQRAAAVLGCTQSKINKIENTFVMVSSKDLEGLLRVYDPTDSDAQKIRLLARQSTAGPSAGAPANQEYLKLLELERQADEVLAWHSERIPNLLQSERYTLKQYERAGQLYDVSSITEGRRERQELFTSTQAPLYRVVFSESSFHRLPGGREASLAVDQIQYVLDMSARYRENLFVQVLPWKADVPFVPHDLTVLRFEDPRNDQVYHEYGAGEGRIYTGRKQVEAHVGYWQDVSRQALDIDGTRGYLRALIDEARSW